VKTGERKKEKRLREGLHKDFT